LPKGTVLANERVRQAGIGSGRGLVPAHRADLLVIHEDTHLDRGAAIPPSKSVARARELARILDSAITIPGTGIRLGLDSIIGLLPAGGDAIGAALSSIIVMTALRQGVPRPIVWRMVANVVIDALIGTVPVIGDLFDVAWKANNRNAELLAQYEGAPEKTTTRSRGFAILVVVVLLVGLGSILTAAALLLRWLFTSL
jgi:hypothetical protein